VSRVTTTPTGRALAERSLASLRGDARVVAFETNVHALAPGVIFALDTYARAELEGDPSLLVIASTLGGLHDGAWSHSVRVVFAGAPFRPPQRTPKPRLVGVQSAVVVGPKGEEIHTDELGRVRVQFAWDREGKLDEESSCWIRVSQGWAGAAYGMAMIPRVGQEVLVGFANGDPDEPLVVGRMYNATAPVPHGLPANATVSAWRSDSSPGSEGYNEIRYDDAKGEELVYVQAEKNLRRW
jgi:type VI secretion system secreted protein VgrG